MKNLRKSLEYLLLDVQQDKSGAKNAEDKTQDNQNELENKKSGTGTGGGLRRVSLSAAMINQENSQTRKLSMF